MTIKVNDYEITISAKCTAPWSDWDEDEATDYVILRLANLLGDAYEATPDKYQHTKELNKKIWLAFAEAAAGR